MSCVRRVGPVVSTFLMEQGARKSMVYTAILETSPQFMSIHYIIVWYLAAQFAGAAFVDRVSI